MTTPTWVSSEWQNVKFFGPANFPSSDELLQARGKNPSAKQGECFRFEHYGMHV